MQRRLFFPYRLHKGSLTPKQTDQSQFSSFLYATQKMVCTSCCKGAQFNKNCVSLINSNVLSDWKILISVVLKEQALWKSLPFKSQGSLASCILKYLLPLLPASINIPCIVPGNMTTEGCCFWEQCYRAGNVDWWLISVIPRSIISGRISEKRLTMWCVGICPSHAGVLLPLP